ncbi:MAG TPA: glycosyltransferase, partial [Puia sp.]|nr:glycosyltransferase [Puia sp.]
GQLSPIGKKEGTLSVVFVGRIHPVKNLDFLLDAMARVRKGVQLTIVGKMEDKQYWQKCEVLIRQLPDPAAVHYIGEIPNHELAALLVRHHLFALPTRGENFGHAIFEALACGRPVLISDQTPWRGLSLAKAGWDLSLGDAAAFSTALDTMAAFGQQQYDDWCRGALRLVKEFVGKTDLREEYKKLFS